MGTLNLMQHWPVNCAERRSRVCLRINHAELYFIVEYITLEKYIKYSK